MRFRDEITDQDRRRNSVYAAVPNMLCEIIPDEVGTVYKKVFPFPINHDAQSGDNESNCKSSESPSLSPQDRHEKRTVRSIKKFSGFSLVS